MPLRALGYISREYEKLIEKRKLYSRRLIKIPTPEFYVFYNGIEDQPVVQELKISDAFLEEYSKFIHMICVNWNAIGDREAAITESVEQCIKAGILEDFLKRNGGEIMSFVNIELTREECEAIREEDGYIRGLEEGEVRGAKKGKVKE